mgnify:CR=1 FL=1
MPERDEKNNGCCKYHTGVRAELDRITHNQDERDNTVTRIWDAIENRVSVKAMISVASGLLLVLGIIVGAMWSGQRDMLILLNKRQSTILEQMVQVKIDTEVIKHKMHMQELERKNGSSNQKN